MDKKKAMTFITYLLVVAVVSMALCLPSRILVPPFLTPSSPLDKSIVKQFLYEVTNDPVTGLTVDLYNDGMAFTDSDITNATGHVQFIGLDDGTFTLKWMWGGVECSEQTQIDCTKIVWDLGINYLESKSGGGTNSAESARQALADSQRENLVSLFLYNCP